MPEWVMIIFAQAFTAGAIYGAIKGDIKMLVNSAQHAQESADEAHKRIDNLLMKGGR